MIVRYCLNVYFYPLLSSCFSFKKDKMNKILFLVLCSFIYLPVCLSQFSGSLQFNRVKLIGATVDRVPLGKVWKVESVLSSSQLAPGLPSNNVAQDKINALQIKVNGTIITISSWLENVYSSYRGHSAFGRVTELPIWFPAGSILEISSNAAYISVIEFNIIP